MVAGGVQTVYLFLCYDILFFHLCCLSEPLFSLCVCINIIDFPLDKFLLKHYETPTYSIYRCPYFSPHNLAIVFDTHPLQRIVSAFIGKSEGSVGEILYLLKF